VRAGADLAAGVCCSRSVARAFRRDLALALLLLALAATATVRGLLDLDAALSGSSEEVEPAAGQLAVRGSSDVLEPLPRRAVERADETITAGEVGARSSGLLPGRLERLRSPRQ